MHNRGEDVEALKAMVAEIQQLVQREGKIERGVFAKFRGLMERNSWITGAIAESLLGLALGQL